MWLLVLHLAGIEYGYAEGRPRDALGSAMSAGAALEHTPEGLTIKPGTCPLIEYVNLRERYLAPNKAAIIKVLKTASAWQVISEPDWAEPALAGVERHWYTDGKQVISLVGGRAEK